MFQSPVFTITYWGVTGTLPSSLLPSDVTQKLVAAIVYLVQQNALADLRTSGELEAQISRRIEELPFHLQSSYGGNTTCVEVQTPDELLILDCGSGLRELGNDLEKRWKSQKSGAQKRAHILVSHPHIDHIGGIPFFAPCFDPANRFTIWSSAEVIQSLGVLFNASSEMSRRYFPQTFDHMKAVGDFCPIEAGSTFRIGSTQIRTHALTHPGGCMAFRLENAGKVFVFATDHEQMQVPDLGLAEFARGADVFYTEGQYTLAEYEGREPVGRNPPLSRRGWGHSPIEACVRTAIAAEVKELHLGHRDPSRNDVDIARLDDFVRELMRKELHLAGRLDNSCSARIVPEGLVVRLGEDESMQE